MFSIIDSRTGLTTYYGLLRVGKQILNNTTHALVARTTANLAACAVALVDTGELGHYSAAIPASTPANQYVLVYCEQFGAAKALGDAVDEDAPFDWSGSVVVYQGGNCFTNLTNIFTAFELDGAVYRLTSNALEQAPANTSVINVSLSELRTA